MYIFKEKFLAAGEWVEGNPTKAVSGVASLILLGVFAQAVAYHRSAESTCEQAFAPHQTEIQASFKKQVEAGNNRPRFDLPEGVEVSAGIITVSPVNCAVQLNENGQQDISFGNYIK